MYFEYKNKILKIELIIIVSLKIKWKKILNKLKLVTFIMFIIFKLSCNLY